MSNMPLRISPHPSLSTHFSSIRIRDQQECMTRTRFCTTQYLTNLNLYILRGSFTFTKNYTGDESIYTYSAIERFLVWACV